MGAAAMTVDTEEMRLFANSIESTKIYEHPYGKRAVSTHLRSAADELDDERAAHETTKGEVSWPICISR